jgi:hypothetical protein
MIYGVTFLNGFVVKSNNVLLKNNTINEIVERTTNGKTMHEKL